MELKNRHLCIPLLLATFCSCRPTTVKPDTSLVMETVPTQEVVKQEVAQQSQVFTVPRNKDSEVWVRARYFFQNHVKGDPIISDYEFFSDLSAGDPLAFQVLRRSTATGVEYAVSCSAKAPRYSDLAAINARNLARFLQKGVLAVDLLPGEEPIA